MFSLLHLSRLTRRYQNKAFGHFNTCLNVDIADLCEQVSHLLHRLFPSEFDSVLHQPSWSWVTTNVPQQPFQGFQLSGAPEQIRDPLPPLLPRSASQSVIDLCSPSEGSVKSETGDELIPVEDVPPYERDVNMVFQSYALFDHLDIADNVFGKSFCALGDGAASPITSSLQYFREEYEQHITGRGCPFDPAASTVWADRQPRRNGSAAHRPAQEKGVLA